MRIRNKNEETVFELLQTNGDSQAKPNKTVRAVMVSSGDKESAKNGNKQGKGMCAGDDVSVVAMSADKSLKLVRKKRRLNGQGDSHSQCIPALRSISYRSKWTPQLIPSDKKAILADIQDSIDCSSVEGPIEPKNVRHERSRVRVAGFLPLNWRMVDRLSWAEVMHMLNAGTRSIMQEIYLLPWLRFTWELLILECISMQSINDTFLAD